MVAETATTRAGSTVMVSTREQGYSRGDRRLTVTDGHPLGKACMENPMLCSLGYARKCTIIGWRTTPYRSMYRTSRYGCVGCRAPLRTPVWFASVPKRLPYLGKYPNYSRYTAQKTALEQSANYISFARTKNKSCPKKYQMPRKPFCAQTPTVPSSPGWLMKALSRQCGPAALKVGLALAQNRRYWRMFHCIDVDEGSVGRGRLLQLIESDSGTYLANATNQEVLRPFPPPTTKLV